MLRAGPPGRTGLRRAFGLLDPHGPVRVISSSVKCRRPESDRTVADDRIFDELEAVLRLRRIEIQEFPTKPNVNMVVVNDLNDRQQAIRASYLARNNLPLGAGWGSFGTLCQL